jgi:hypothetical protein
MKERTCRTCFFRERPMCGDCALLDYAPGWLPRPYWTSSEREGLKAMGKLFLNLHGSGEKYKQGAIVARLSIIDFVKAVIAARGNGG